MKQIKIYDTSKKEMVDFIPQNESNVKVYCCGPTVYSYAHIGNLRAAVFADIVFRVLRHRYGIRNVRYARNITDIDDKIISKAVKNQQSYLEVARLYEDVYKEDVESINCLTPTYEPRATDYVGEMLADIDSMVKSGSAYISNGHVYYNIKKKHRDTFDVTIDDSFNSDRNLSSGKKNKQDFVLWKPVGEGPIWNSKYGEGRMGWHTECVSMIASIFNEPNDENGFIIDLHLGGKDLKFPHHENECAQSHSAFGKELSKYWAHNGFITIDGEKGSKTSGNIPSLQYFLDKYNLEVIRYFLLSSNYGTDMAYFDEKIYQCKSVMDSFYEVKGCDYDPEDYIIDDEFLSHMYNNFDTVNAMKRLKEMLKIFNTTKDCKEYGSLLASLNFLGLGMVHYNDWWGITDDEEIDNLIKQREFFRKSNKYEEADQIRSKLSEMGIHLIDEAGVTTWKKKE